MSVIPVRADGTKKPLDQWKNAQDHRMSAHSVQARWTANPELGVAVVCGKISGNLEMLELEGCAATSEHLDLIWDAIGDDAEVLTFWTELMECGYSESTPSGGLHFMYRIRDHEVPGNTKIANRPPTPEELADKPHLRAVTLSETRGEGGYVIVAPTQGSVHPSGDAWTCLAGDPNVPYVDWSVRNRLHKAIADALDTMPEVVQWVPRERAVVERPAGDVLPGEDYNARESWDYLLSDYGWQYHSNIPGGGEFWTRPGKRVIDGHSASVGFKGSDNLYVFSSSTDLETNKPISKFAFYTFMEHRGDFSAAGRALYAKGYGTRLEHEPLDISDWDVESPAERTGPTVEASEEPVESEAPEEPKKLRVIHEWTETGAAHLVVQACGKRFRYVHEEKAFRTYSGGVWARDGRASVEQSVEKVTSVIRKQAQEILQAAQETEDKEEIREAKKIVTTANGFRSDRGINAIVRRFAAQPGIAVESADFDSARNLICLDNGTFDLSTMTLREHSPDDLLTKRIRLAFDESAQCPGFEKYLEEAIPDPAYRDYLRRALAMTLLGEIREAAFFVLHGETGCGKSQFMKIAEVLLGEYAATAARGTFSAAKFGGDDAYALHDLRGVRMASMSETKRGEVLNEDLIKRVTGGDTVKTRGLYESFVSWKPQFTVWLLTNFLPNLDAGDGAIWRRVKPIHFPNQFKGDKAEIGLAERLIAEELPGIFNWLLKGVEDYRAHGLKDPETLTEEVEAYRDSLDPVLEFLTDAEADGTIVIGESQSIPVSALYGVFVEWSHSNGNRFPLGKKRFGERMDELGFKTHRGSGGSRSRLGIGKNMANLSSGTGQFGGWR